MFTQMPLSVGLKDELSFETYVVDTEEQAISLNQFQLALTKQESQTYYLFGEEGVGRTHLLLSACRFVMTLGQSSMYVPLADDTLPLHPSILSGLESTDLICLDDVESKLGDPEWELALTQLIQKAATLGHKLVLAGRLPFEEWHIETSELTHALFSVLPLSLTKLDKKESLVEALKRHASKQGFEISVDVGNYLVKQFSSDLQELLAVLKLLEQASIVEKRKVTLPFVKQVLNH